MHFGKIINGSDGGGCNPSIDIPRIHNISHLNIVDFSKLVTNEFSLGEINIAIECMRNGESSGRCLINFNN